MKIKIITGFILLVPSLSFAQSNGTANALGSCAASLPAVNAQRCNEPSYFSEYRTAADKAINAENDEKTNTLYKDNQANNKTVVSTAKKDLGNFAQCQLDVCQAYFDTCTSGDISDVSSRRFEENAGQCIEQSEKRFDVAKALSTTSVKMNVQTKAMATIKQTSAAINHSYKTIVAPMLQNIAKITREWAGKSSTMVKETRDVDKSTVQ